MFCYLKIERWAHDIGQTDIDTGERRSELEVAVNDALARTNLGCTTGGGSGFRYAYVHLALTDVPAAVPVLRQVVQFMKLSSRAWLLFFEPELAEEWVGMYPETVAPPMKKRETQ